MCTERVSNAASRGDEDVGAGGEARDFRGGEAGAES